MSCCGGSSAVTLRSINRRSQLERLRPSSAARRLAVARMSALRLMVAVVCPGARLPARLCSGLGFGFMRSLYIFLTGNQK